MKKIIQITTIILLIFSCKENARNNRLEQKKQFEKSKQDTAKVKKEIELKSYRLIEETIGNKTYKEYFLGDIKVQLNQYTNDGTEFYCKAEIIISKNGKILDYIYFSPEPVGGNFGISSGVKFNNHLIFTKHGDYNGRTLIINDKGQIYNIIGGKNYLDEESQLLFSIHESDLSSFAVFDLKTDSILLTMENIEESPIKFYKKLRSSYYSLCTNNQTEKESIWKIDFKSKKILPTELDKIDFNSKNEIKNITDEEVYCICEN